MKQKNPYEKVIKKFLVLLGLLFVSPIIFSVAFKAERIYTEGLGVYISYILIALGCSLLIFTVYFGFKTFQSLLDVLFRK